MAYVNVDDKINELKLQVYALAGVVAVAGEIITRSGITPSDLRYSFADATNLMKIFVEEAETLKAQGAIAAKTQKSATNVFSVNTPQSKGPVNAAHVLDREDVEALRAVVDHLKSKGLIDRARQIDKIVCKAKNTLPPSEIPEKEVQPKKLPVDDLVDRFAEALRAKLHAAEKKYAWGDGWLKDDWEEDCREQLEDHVEKGDPLDVAAYAAFCWHHDWPTSNGEDAIAEANHFRVSSSLMETFTGAHWASLIPGGDQYSPGTQAYWLALGDHAMDVVAKDLLPEGVRLEKSGLIPYAKAKR